MRSGGNSVLVLVASLLGAAGAANAAEQRIFVGTYTQQGSASDGIYTCLLNSEDGSLSAPQLSAAADNPSFLAVHPNGKLLFAVNELTEFNGESSGAASAFRVDRDTGKLTLLNQQPTGGGAPCHCNVDATGRWLLVANYVGGNLAVFPIAEDGTLGERSCLINHVGSGAVLPQQATPHAHSINLSQNNRFAYAADLGTDRIMIYRFDSQRGLLVPNTPSSVELLPGSGPRHFSLHPSGKYAYTNNEITRFVTAFKRDAESGGLTPVQNLSTLPGGSDAGGSTAECLVHPTGRFLYVSNRGHDSIAVFAIDQKDGTLAAVEHESTQGKAPRNFFITPDGRWLLAENQNSDSVVVFSIDDSDGSLTPTGSQITVGRPVCIRMLP